MPGCQKEPLAWVRVSVTGLSLSTSSHRTRILEPSVYVGFALKSFLFPMGPGLENRTHVAVVTRAATRAARCIRTMARRYKEMGNCTERRRREEKEHTAKDRGPPCTYHISAPRPESG